MILVGYVNLVPYLYPPRWEGLPQRPSLTDITTVQQTYQIIGLTAWGEYSDARVTAWPTGPVVPPGASLAEKLVTAVPENSLILQQSDPWTAVWQTSFTEPTTLTFASHTYDEMHLLMPLYICRTWDGEIEPREGQEIAWVRTNKLQHYPMPPADAPLIPALRDLLL